jgi:hypothetical protein
MSRDEADAPDLDPENAAFLKCFWEAYSGYSASQLYRMTHSETPWQKARTDRPNTNPPIPVADIEEFFSRQTVPAPLAAYSHDLRKREEQAERKLREIPPIDLERFRASATSFTPAALPKSAGGNNVAVKIPLGNIVLVRQVPDKQGGNHKDRFIVAAPRPLTGWARVATMPGMPPSFLRGSANRKVSSSPAPGILH